MPKYCLSKYTCPFDLSNVRSDHSKFFSKMGHDSINIITIPTSYIVFKQFSYGCKINNLKLLIEYEIINNISFFNIYLPNM